MARKKTENRFKKPRPASITEKKISPLDSRLKQLLVEHYHKLVLTELNAPILLSSTFLGIRMSRKMAEDLASANNQIPSLGSYGVFEDGIPFYHMHIQTLTADEQKRLEDNGVRLRTGNFSKEEDDQIRSNWQEYCELAEIDPDEVSAYMGCSKYGQKKKASVFFRPWMCRGLPERSGIQVYRRCQVIFHPSNLEDEGLTRPWTKDELKVLASLGPTGKWAQIGTRLNRPRYHCIKAYRRLVNGGYIDGEEDNDLVFLYRNITKAIRKDPVKALICGQLDALEKAIDWEEIGRLMSWEPKRCKKAYKQLKERMVEAKNAEDAQDERPKKLMKRVRKGLPKACQRVSRLQTKRRSPLKIPPKDFAGHVKALYRQHREELENLRKPYRFASVFIASEALAEHSEEDRISILKRLNYITAMFESRGFFDYLPMENRSALVKLKMVAYVMKKLYRTRIKTSEALERAKKFVEKQGWTPTRTVLAYKISPKKHKQMKIE